jgi:hypothetical protein
MKKIITIIIILSAIIFLFLVLERHRVPKTTDEMIVEAENFGQVQGKEIPPRPFVFDGCTLFLDGFLDSSFLSACLEHDIAYYYGGSKEERLMADRVFKEAIGQSGKAGMVFKYPMYWGVRLLGDSFIARSQNANWGSGYNL